MSHNVHSISASSYVRDIAKVCECVYNAFVIKPNLSMILLPCRKARSAPGADRVVCRMRIVIKPMLYQSKAYFILHRLGYQNFLLAIRGVDPGGGGGGSRPNQNIGGANIVLPPPPPKKKKKNNNNNNNNNFDNLKKKKNHVYCKIKNRFKKHCKSLQNH